MPDEPSSDRKGGFLAFWTTLPGILTGLAALITAIVGAVGLWKSQSGDNRAATSTESSLTTSTSETGSSQGTGSRSPGKGVLRLVRGDTADLETGQIGFSGQADLQFGPGSNPNLFAAGSAFLAPLEGKPTKRACVRVLSGRRDAFEVLAELDTKMICVSTTERNVALVRVIRTPGVGNAKLVLGYTVWR